MADTTWYRVELEGTGERFIETDMGFDDFKAGVAEGRIIAVLRQVIALPMRDDQGRSGISFVTIEKFSPLVSGCKPGTEHVNLGRVVGFAEVDTDSDMWQAVLDNALSESEIVTPKKGIVIPG